MSLAKFLRRLSIGMIWLTSAYVLLMLLIALTNQGELTGNVDAASLNQLSYPIWYANSLVTTAVKIAVLAYPAAAVAYGLASLLAYAANEKPVQDGYSQRGYGKDLPSASAAASSFAVTLDTRVSEIASAKPISAAPHPIDPAENPDNLCILDMAFLIRAISPNAAAILGRAPETMLRRPFINFVVPADITQLLAAVC